MDPDLPFELRALECALQAEVDSMEQQAVSVDSQLVPCLERLVQKVP